jgi:prepilin-type N-terminal cleavage/methylation domain-containing protein
MAGSTTILIMKNRAFTLIEITIVVTIITIMATIFIANYKGGEKNFALQRSANKLGQDLRRAQEMAMSSQETPDSFGDPVTFPKGGYGIHFEEDSSNYTLFADCDGGQDYDQSGTALSCYYADQAPGASISEKLEILNLEKDIFISSVSPSLPDNSLIITFFPPNPEITINGDPSITAAVITLTFEGAEAPRTVSVYKTGLIDID